MSRLLLGAYDDNDLVDRFLRPQIDAGNWRTFGAATPSFEAALAGWATPDALLVNVTYTPVPDWVWAAPVPVVALAADPNLLWHPLKHALHLADLVLTDAPSAEKMRLSGIGHARAANLYGLDRHFAAELDVPESERDIDLLFVGSTNPATQGERLPWLGRLAALADACRVVIATGVFGDEYRALLRRAKLAFNRSVRSECNLRALEAAACGAVLLQEAENDEVPEYLEPGVEYVTYTGANLEDTVGRLLGNEAERRAIADAARERARYQTFDALLRVGLGVGVKGWAEVKERARERTRKPVRVSLAARVWRAAVAGPGADPPLPADLSAAKDRHALGALARTPTEAEPHLAAAAASGNRASAVGRAAALAALGRGAEAAAQLNRTIAALDAGAELTPAESDGVPYPVRFDHLRVGWERAGYDHPDHPAAERTEKARLLRGQALALLGELTGDAGAWERAVGCCPEWPHLHAGLGTALVRAGQPGAAADALRRALALNPFDNAPAQLLVEALVAAREPGEAERVSVHRRLLATAAPKLVAEIGPLRTVPKPVPPPAEPVAPAPVIAPAPAAAPIPVPQPSLPAIPAPAAPAPRGAGFVDLPRAAFTARFGTPDTSAALGGSADVHAVLALLTHARPRRVLEIGTAGGAMTANLTTGTPPDAVVYSLGARVEDRLDHFGTGHKALLVPADPRTYDFARLAPLDFALVAGENAPAPAVYGALRPGGLLVWLGTDGTDATRAFPETAYRVEGTRVAFLIKGEGLGARAAADSGRVAVTWDGAVDAVHSLAAVNRALCSELVARGHAVGIAPQFAGGVPATPLPVPPELVPLFGQIEPGAVHVRHRWPPDFTPPEGTGPLVLIQPWEYGKVPRAWVEPITALVDELWVPSRAVLRAFVASGVPEARIAVVPNGVDPDRFRPGLDPLPLPTEKRVKLLFVGGTIRRKGFDLLLAAYRHAFRNTDDVCLVVKDMGVGTFYRNRLGDELVARMRADPAAPEVLYLTDDLTEDELPRLYTACDALVHPYRGEGFGLPVLEAMAGGLPVVVTAGGPTDEFVPQSAGWRVPARLRYFDREAVGDIPTAGLPWELEPDADALVAILKAVATGADERKRRGAAGRRAALGFTWARAASAVEDRVRVLRTRAPVRFRRPAPVHRAAPAAAPVRTFVGTVGGEPVTFAPAVTLRTDEEFGPPVPVRDRITVPAVAGRPRVSLTMIVKNEEKNLPDCLASVRDLVDEAVVIDTGSTDRTRDVAARFACVVGEFPWIDHFAAARNAALEKATGDYAFWMDADDRLDDENRAKLRALFDSLPAGNAAYVMKCLCAGEGSHPGAAGTAVDHVRLFRHHPAHRWTFRIHEQILPALRATGAEVHWADVCVRHVGYVDPAVRRRKLERDLRLLKLEEAEQPDHAFTLFNLGSVYHELGQFPAAIGALEKSLAGSRPEDSIVRKTYALIARCHHGLGDRKGAEATCRKGRTYYPDDAELLFLAAGYAREAGDLGAAEGLYRKLIDGSEGPHFASVDTSLRAVKGRHNLAVMLLEQGRVGEAEGLWRAALTHDPYFLPAQVGLGEVYAATGNDAGLARQVGALEGFGEAGVAEAAVLQARLKSARKDHAGAAAVLEDAIRRMPGALGVRVALSHVHIAADSPPEAMERAFRGVLELDPHNDQAKHNLEVLYRKTGRWVEGVQDGSQPPPAA